MAYSEASTAKAQPGTRFRLMLNQPITVAGTVVVPKGAWAFGEVISAEESGGLGHSGRMSARLLYLKAGDAEIPLDGGLCEVTRRRRDREDHARDHALPPRCLQ